MFLSVRLPVCRVLHAAAAAANAPKHTTLSRIVFTVD